MPNWTEEETPSSEASVAYVPRASYKQTVFQEKSSPRPFCQNVSASKKLYEFTKRSNYEGDTVAERSKLLLLRETMKENPEIPSYLPPARALLKYFKKFPLKLTF